MKKQTKMLLGVAILGVAGYFYWQSKQPKKVGFVNNPSKKIFTNASGQIFSKETGKQIFTNASGQIFSKETGKQIFK
jgi:predicted negative regulator of RcsB-dependent stress response